MNILKSMSLKIVVLFIVIVVMVLVSISTITANVKVYYVSPSGNDANPGTAVKPWKTLNHAEDILHAGDTLYVRGGTYSGDYFHPVNSGIAVSPITVKAYKDEVPVITTDEGSLHEIVTFMRSINYMVLDGLTFDNTGQNTNICFYGNKYITIRNCTFKKSLDSFIYMNESSYITIEKCSFDTCGNPLGEGFGDSIYVNGCNHVLIQNNYIKKAGHYAVDLKEMNGEPIYSYNNIIRNNVIEQHWGGGIGIICKSHNNLVENNKVYYIGEECIEYGKTGIQVAADENIIRNNIISKASSGPVVDTGITMSSYYLDVRNMNQNCVDNRIYNNIIYKNGGMPVQINAKHNTDFTGNKIMNNIMYYNRLAGDDYDPWFKNNYHILFETWHLSLEKLWGSNFPNNNYFYNNDIAHATTDGDKPGSVRIFYDGVANVDGTKIEGVYKFDKSLVEVQKSYHDYFHDNIEKNPGFINADKDDFRLTSGSPALNTGAHLTKTIASRKNTKVVSVKDALFFTDGYGIIPGDIVRIGSNSNVQITAVDYDGGTITVSAPVSFNAGENVDLQYLGSSPDMGINEKLAVDTLENLDETLRSGAKNNYIKGTNLLNSLLVKVESIQKEIRKNKNALQGLNALKNEVDAQSGKGISKNFAVSFLKTVSYLIELCKK